MEGHKDGEREKHLRRSLRNHKEPDLELPSIMESLSINESSEAKKTTPLSIDRFYELVNVPSVAIRRKDKRRCFLEPTKFYSGRCELDVNSEKCSCRCPSRYLETIYEEPVSTKNGKMKYTGICRSRKMQFIRRHSMSKLREEKLNRCTLRDIRKRKLNMEAFIERFHEVMRTNDNAQVTIVEKPDEPDVCEKQ